MRMSSLKGKTSSHHRLSTGRRVWVIIATVLFAALLALVFGQGIGSVVSLVAKPARAARIWLSESTSVVPTYLRDVSSLIEERDTLRRELASHEGDAATVARLTEEVHLLRTLLSSTTTDSILSGVLARPNETPYDTLLIDRGMEHGVKERAVVYASSKIPIGTVSNVYPASALVTLFTTPGVRSTAYIYGPDIYTTTQGMGGGVMRVSVPQGIELSAGDPVILPSVDSGTYGLIEYVESVESSPLQYGFLTTPVSISSLRYVTVNRDSLDTVSYEEAKKIVENARDDFLRIDIPTEILVGTSTPTTTSDILHEPPLGDTDTVQ